MLDEGLRPVRALIKDLGTPWCCSRLAQQSTPVIFSVPIAVSQLWGMKNKISD